MPLSAQRTDEARQRRLVARLSQSLTIFFNRLLGQQPAPPPWRAGATLGPIRCTRLLRILARLAAGAAAPAADDAPVDFEHVHEHSGSETDGSVVSAASTVSEEDYDPFADYPAPQQ